jgi:hypothetical protein
MTSPKEIRKASRGMNAMARQLELVELSKTPGALQTKLLKEAKAKMNRKVKAMLRKSLGL